MLACCNWHMQLKTTHLNGWPGTGLRDFLFSLWHTGTGHGKDKMAIPSVISRRNHYPGYAGCYMLQLTMHWSLALMLLPDYCYWVKLQFLTRPTNLQQTLWCIFYGDIKIQATLRFISLQSLCCPLRSQKMIFYPKTINSASNNAETFSSISA